MKEGCPQTAQAPGGASGCRGIAFLTRQRAMAVAALLTIAALPWRRSQSAVAYASMGACATCLLFFVRLAREGRRRHVQTRLLAMYWRHHASCRSRIPEQLMAVAPIALAA
jgi:hypothetical protein